MSAPLSAASSASNGAPPWVVGEALGDLGDTRTTGPYRIVDPSIGVAAPGAANQRVGPPPLESTLTEIAELAADLRALVEESGRAAVEPSEDGASPLWSEDEDAVSEPVRDDGELPAPPEWDGEPGTSPAALAGVPDEPGVLPIAGRPVIAWDDDDLDESGDAHRILAATERVPEAVDDEPSDDASLDDGAAITASVEVDEVPAVQPEPASTDESAGDEDPAWTDDDPEPAWLTEMRSANAAVEPPLAAASAAADTVGAEAPEAAAWGASPSGLYAEIDDPFALPPGRGETIRADMTATRAVLGPTWDDDPHGGLDVPMTVPGRGLKVFGALVVLATLAAGVAAFVIAAS